ncbi:MAG: 16S rRNA methyltransferase [Thermoproteus sp.]|nr:16S rRNA methyltransferase [Thermoproteus sp.]
MILVLAESSLELVPSEIAGHPAILSDARRRRKRPSEILLDRAKHHRAMRGLPKAEKRGRPDIVHQSALAFQYSILNKKGFGKLYIHTLSNIIIEIESNTRLPKNYNNFIGLMEQLLKEGRTPPRGRPLTRAEKGDLKELLDSLGGRWIVLHENGARVDPFELGRRLARSVVVVGGFPHGDFENRWVLHRADGVFRIGDYPLDSWQVVYRAVTLAEIALGLL